MCVYGLAKNVDFVDGWARLEAGLLLSVDKTFWNYLGVVSWFE